MVLSFNEGTRIRIYKIIHRNFIPKLRKFLVEHIYTVLNSIVLDTKQIKILFEIDKLTGLSNQRCVKIPHKVSES